MIDLKAAEDLANAGAGNDSITVSRSWLQQVVKEIAEARAAKDGKAAK